MSLKDLNDKFAEASTKIDNSIIHSYRMKSIGFIIEKYNSFISCVASDGIYRLLVTFHEK